VTYGTGGKRVVAGHTLAAHSHESACGAVLVVCQRKPL